MTDVDTLLREYIEAHQARGEADPREWLARAEGRDRLRLEVMIDRYLEQAPGRPWDPEGFRESGMARVAEQLTDALAGQAGMWPTVLPRLRDRVGLKRAELVARLAAALGAQGKEEKVGSYYHQMEKGLLPAEGVSDKVLDALGTIIGQSAEVLRRAGSMVSPGGATASDAPAFARQVKGMPSLEYADAEMAPSAAPEPEEMDEVDRLFRAG